MRDNMLGATATDSLKEAASNKPDLELLLVDDDRKDELASDAAAAAKGLNDNAHGIDRFGYRVSCPFPNAPCCSVHRPAPPPISISSPWRKHWPQCSNEQNHPSALGCMRDGARARHS